MTEEVNIEHAENPSAYPPSIQAGIPKLGETPRGWTRYPLGDLLLKVERPARLTDNQTYQLVTAKRNRGGIVAREVLRGDQIKTKTQFYVEAGDFLISNRQISHGACGLVPPQLHRAIVSNEYTAFHAKEKLEPTFLNALMHSVYFQQTCFHSSIGVHVEKLVFRLEDWLKWAFDVPPLEEQRRIVAVLETWDRAIDQTERLIASKRKRFEGLLAQYAMKFHNERTEFGALVELISERVQPGVCDVPNESTELENIEPETGRIIGSSRVSAESALRSRFKAKDTLFGKLRPYLRKVAQPSFDGICSTEIWVLRSNPKVLNPDLLFFLVQTQEFQATATKQSGSKMPRADWDLVSTTPVPCPRAMDQQIRAAALLDSALQSIHPELKRLDAHRAQKRGLMQKLLTGEWRLDGRFEPAALTSRAVLPGDAA